MAKRAPLATSPALPIGPGIVLRIIKGGILRRSILRLSQRDITLFKTALQAYERRYPNISRIELWVQEMPNGQGRFVSPGAPGAQVSNVGLLFGLVLTKIPGYVRTIRRKPSWRMTFHGDTSKATSSNCRRVGLPVP